MKKTSSLNSDRDKDMLRSGAVGGGVPGDIPSELDPSFQDNTPGKKDLEAENQKPPMKAFTWRLLTFLGMALLAYIGFSVMRQQGAIPIEDTQTPEPSMLVTFVPANSTDTLQPVFQSTSTITPIPFVCPYQGQTDHETIVRLIMAEAEAVNTENLAIINTIFAPNADFYDYASEPPDHWSGPRARYAANLFQTTDFKEVEHFDILPAGLGIAGDIAYYTSGSKGNYRIGAGSRVEFSNGSVNSTEYGSDHWILEKNSSGCWVIIEMQFNAGDERFP